jgi:hypothetical protein
MNAYYAEVAPLEGGAGQAARSAQLASTATTIQLLMAMTIVFRAKGLPRDEGVQNLRRNASPDFTFLKELTIA